VLLNKIDLLGVLPFDEELLKSDLARLNTRAPLLKVSALGGQGLEAWVEWLRMRRARVLQGD
jgi:hydrogenase nickel incorporation protein HypB